MPTLKEARAAKLLTVRALAAKAGVAASTVYLIENGRATPRFSVIAKLCTALGVEPAAVDEFAAAMRQVAEGERRAHRSHAKEDVGCAS